MKGFFSDSAFAEQFFIAAAWGLVFMIFWMKWKIADDYGKRSTLNLKILASLLNANINSNFLTTFEIEGTYKGRKIFCGSSSQMFWTRAAEHGVFDERCPAALCMIPNVPGWKRNSFPKTLGACYLNKITLYTGMANDLIYYNYMPHEDRNFKIFRNVGLYRRVPLEKFIKDKKSFYAIFAMRLSESEVRFFLDELVRAAEIIEKKNSVT